jgi:hypothetical protein
LSILVLGGGNGDWRSVGGGETSEGFGEDYSLPNHAYCESCAGCGELFFQHNLRRAYYLDSATLCGRNGVTRETVDTSATTDLASAER